jgi:hypothetical protein
MFARTQMVYKTVRQKTKESDKDNGTKERIPILSELVRRPNMLSQDNVQQQQRRPLTLEEDRFWCGDMRATELCGRMRSLSTSSSTHDSSQSGKPEGQKGGIGYPEPLHLN